MSTRPRLPATKGDTWESGAKDGGFTTAYQGEEEIEVPAGKFKAHRVALTVAPGITVSVWLARGVGPVKVETNGAGVGQVLKSFKPGK